ncbi:hypothetical protein VTI74DRAFT_10174 [Chaetomium olivicolor]
MEYMHVGNGTAVDGQQYCIASVLLLFSSHLLFPLSPARGLSPQPPPINSSITTQTYTLSHSLSLRVAASPVLRSSLPPLSDIPPRHQPVSLQLLHENSAAPNVMKEQLKDGRNTTLRHSQVCSLQSLTSESFLCCSFVHVDKKALFSQAKLGKVKVVGRYDLSPLLLPLVLSFPCFLHRFLLLLSLTPPSCHSPIPSLTSSVPLHSPCPHAPLPADQE